MQAYKRLLFSDVLEKNESLTSEKEKDKNDEIL